MGLLIDGIEYALIVLVACVVVSLVLSFFDRED